MPDVAQTPPDAKKKSIVGGYNPSDSFADIFDSWLATGDPYAAPHQRTGKKTAASTRRNEAPSSQPEKPSEPQRSFGDILSEWEKKAGPAHNAGAFHEKKKEAPESANHHLPPRLSDIRKMLPQATLDLHGYTTEQAAARVRSFLFDSREKRLVKVCIIHGKGIHAQDGESVLKPVVLDEIRRSGMVSEAYVPAARHGGSGAMWIILKR